jgi:hypothetical protein
MVQHKALSHSKPTGHLHQCSLLHANAPEDRKSKALERIWVLVATQLQESRAAVFHQARKGCDLTVHHHQDAGLALGHKGHEGHQISF